MPPRERPIDRSVRRARRSLVDLGAEVREARMAAGLTCAQVAAACAISTSYEAKIERGEAGSVAVVLLARVVGVVGLDLAVRAFPGGSPMRDAAHLALLRRLRSTIHPSWTWRTEVPIPLAGDPRSWDAVVAGADVRIGVEAETRVRDIQALERRISLKLRDSGFERAVLVLADTRSNRAAMRTYGDALRVPFPVPSRVARPALAAGRDPGGSAIIVL